MPGNSSTFTQDTLSFLKALEANNTRDWFTDHKADYEAAVKRPAEAFARAMEAELEALTGERQTAKVFRIHRDLRFSKDKTPYNTHIRIGWMGNGGAMWMWGLDGSGLAIGAGVFAFDKPVLARYREALTGDWGAGLAGVLGDLAVAGFRLGEPDLARVPQGSDPQAPRAELMRHKGIHAWRDLPPDAALGSGAVGTARETFASLLPLHRILAQLT